MHSVNLLYSLSGFAVGFLVGMTGVGGGSLMTPVLILLFGIHPATAVGTDLLYAAATKTGGSLVHGLGGTIDWRVVGRLAAGIGHWIIGSIDFLLLGSLLMGSLPGIFLGSYMSSRVPDVALRMTLAATLIVAGSKLML